MVQSGQTGGPSGRERGIALLMVITTLVALMVIAVPFAISMRLGLERSEAHNARKRARDIVDSTMSFLEATLVRTTERVEAQNRDADQKGQTADPELDTLSEITPTRADLALTLGVLEEELHDPYGLIVGWTVEDENGKFNLNDASFFALGNLMGLSVLTSEFNEGDRTLELEDGANFPSRGYVKVGRELVKYTGKSGNQLTGCERGLGASLPEHGAEEKHAENDWVVNYAAWAIAYYHVARNPGEWTDFDALDVSDISSLVELDPEIPVLTQADWERVKPYVTVWSKGEAASGWSNAQAVVEGTRMPGKAEKAETFKFGNSWFYNTGTMIRVSERSEAVSDREAVRDEKRLRVRRKDYAMCFSSQPGNVGESRMEFFGKVHRRFDGNRTRIEYRIRNPINVNTAPREVIVALFSNLSLRTRLSSRVTPEEAGKVADAIIARRTSDTPLRSMRDFRDLLDELREQNTIDLEDKTAIYTNALNSQDQGLTFGTAPITFRTYDVYTLRASAIVCNRGGEQLANHSASRVVEIGSQLTASRTWESQRDFEEQLVATADPRWWATAPFNTGYFVREDVEPWPRAPQQILRSVFPLDPLSKQADEERPFESSRDQRDLVTTNGDFSLAPARLLFDTALINPRAVLHFDNEQFIEGKVVDAGFGVALNGAPWNAFDGDDGQVEPFAISFWIQPRGGSGDQPIFDFAEDEYRNRYACYVDGETNELVFAVADNTDTLAAAELRYNLTDQGGFVETIWYHVHLIATGAHPGKMSMIVDGRAVGKPNVMSFLSQSLDASGSSIPVEDTTFFPESGGVLIGTEVVEYESKTQGALNVRLDVDGNPIGRGARHTFAKTHPEGDVVTLFGYARPLLSTLPTGGAQTQNDMGPWSPTVLNTLADQVDNDMYGSYTPAIKTYFFTVTDSGEVGGGGGGGPGATPLGVPLLPLQGQPPPPATNVTTFTLPFEVGDWSGFTLTTYGLLIEEGGTTPTAEEQLRAFQEDGYALMAYIGGSTNDFENMSGGNFDGILGHVELVRYKKSGTTLSVQRQNDAKAGTQTGPDRGGSWEILLGWMKTKSGSGAQRVGAPVYLVPVSVRTTPTAADTYLNPPDDPDIDYWFAQILQESQGDGADESRIWEWIRYSEVVFAGDANYFLQAKVVNQTLFLDSVHDQRMEESTVDALRAPVATGAGEVEALLAATPDKTYNNWSPGSSAQPPGNGNVRGMGDLVRLRGVQSERSQDQRFVDDWWQDENDPIVPDGTPVIPVAASYAGPTSLSTFTTDNQDSLGADQGVWPLPGRFDRVNVVTGDDQVREGGDLFCWFGMDGLDTRLYDRVDIAGTGTVQPFQLPYNVHLFALERDVQNRFEVSEDVAPGDEDVRDTTRLLCFPTGEMPDNRNAMSEPRIGMSYTGDTLGCVIDEVSGEGRQVFHALTLADEEIDEGAQSFSATSSVGAPDGAILPDGPGLVRIGEELITFREADVVGNVIEFGGCTRGVLRTAPGNYSRGAPVEVMFNVIVGVLTESLSDSSSQIFCLGVEQFPTSGVVRIESPQTDEADLRLYTLIQQGALTMPISDFGAGIFTARYGTASLTHESGTPVFYQPIRVWDRFAEVSDDPELAYFAFSTELRDAFIKRVYWQEGQAVPNVTVRAVVRVDEGTEWNARPERQLAIDRQGLEGGSGGAVSNTDRARLERSVNPREFLFVTGSGRDDNLINLQASRVQARIFVVFQPGAYVWNNPSAYGWKSRFPIQRFAIEYVQQNRTLLHVDE